MSKSRGLVILYEDLNERWIEWAKQARLSTLGIHKIALPGHASLEELVADLEKPQGRKMIDRLKETGIRVEYELHSLEWLLPRNLFEKNKEMFRVNDQGERTNDSNFCPSSKEAAEIISERAYKLAKILGQDSPYYFLWPDDASGAGCSCEKCLENGYNGADLGMIFSNAVAEGLKAYNSEACESYIVYADAKKALPTVRPAENVFMEFAPMDRNHDKSMNDPNEERGQNYIQLLKDVLNIFPAQSSHVLEYWMDNALYSDFKKPPVKIPFHADVMEEDVKMYTSFGIQNIKSFGSYLDEEYYGLHGDPPVKEYGDILAKYIEL